MRSGKSLVFGFATVLAILCGSLGIAHAQYAAPPRYYAPRYGYGYPPPPPPPGVYRQGFVIGFAGGLGAIDADNCGDACGAAGVLEGHIGGMLNPRTAMLFEVWGAVHPWTDANGDSRTTSNTFFTGALQFWVNNIFWIKGGAGVGYIATPNESVPGVNEGNESGFALFGAAGVEVLQAYNFALDLQFRAGNGFYHIDGSAQNYAFMVGLNWY